MDTREAIKTLRELQSQIIHGKNTFGEIADFIESDEEGSAKMLGMATDLNLDLQNKADMWRDEFARIKCIIEGGGDDDNAPFLEITGICERALKDIRSNICLIDQREKVADENATLRKEICKLRTLLATCYAKSALYHDDGELQDNRTRPFIDFKRDTLDEIQWKMLERVRLACEELGNESTEASHGDDKT